MTFWYDMCKACHHVFKPKRITKPQLESRLGCLCLCHWGNQNAGGITMQQAENLTKRDRKYDYIDMYYDNMEKFNI